MWLSLKNIKKSYLNGKRVIQVLRGVSLEIEQGEKLAIVGPSGSGKTTLLNIMGTLDRPDEGELFFENKALDWSDEELLSSIRREKLGFVFQFYHLMPELNVNENIILPAMMAGWAKSRIEDRAEELLERLGLSDKRESKVYSLSGGERQRVAIARAIFLYPQILLADEPTGNLDADSAKEVIQLFLELNEYQGLTLVLVTHNLEIARKMDKVYLLKEGSLVEL
ncbi:MAG: ABC transporter ATP-binding protein [Caldimicrobium sp.]|nr:ABC transporter ATP-binding protein [Caldimicrobium sp.]MCX7613297.1 ABC transporter ATP-binding protein [Caldimicrobium sp.]MDW8183422.1 ABC transporter ATP-binding protein [Caldimicrobium sp.]